jgi:hypothetical protein
MFSLRFSIDDVLLVLLAACSAAQATAVPPRACIQMVQMGGAPDYVDGGRLQEYVGLASLESIAGRRMFHTRMDIATARQRCRSDVD